MKDKDYTSPEAVDRLLAPPQSYGNGYDCCDQQVALAHALRDARVEIKHLKSMVQVAHCTMVPGLGPCECPVCSEEKK